MAKDRRHEKPFIKQKQALYIGIAAIVLVAVIVMIAVLVRPAPKPIDGPLIPPVAEGTTTTVATSGTTQQATTTTTETTTTVMTTTEEEETTTEAEETTTEAEEPTTTEAEEPTTTAAPPVNYDDGEWNRILVNPWNALSREELDDESRLVYAENGEYVDERILSQLNAMLAAGSEYGLYVTSGYRSYDTQEYLYNNKVDRVIASEGCSYEEALDIAATVVARPGTSEHHTGLAVDLLHNECWELEEYWEDSAAFDWMMANCADYGFILRYPKQSQHITGVIYEPWHYRYVGVEAAREIMSRGITLEEYLAEQ